MIAGGGPISRRKISAFLIVLLVILVVATVLNSWQLSRLRVVIANVHGGIEVKVIVLLDGDVVSDKTIQSYSTFSHTYWVVHGQHSIYIYWHSMESDYEPHYVQSGLVDGKLGNLNAIDVHILDSVTVQVNVG